MAKFKITMTCIVDDPELTKESLEADNGDQSFDSLITASEDNDESYKLIVEEVKD